MATFLLTWRGTGALDLSQVLDQSGQPVLFPQSGTSVLVHSSVLQHPFVKRYVNERLLEATSLDGPAVPVRVAPPLKTETVPVQETLAIKATPVLVPEPVPVPPEVALPEPPGVLSEEPPHPTTVVPDSEETITADITVPVVTTTTNEPSADPVVDSTTKPDWKRPRRGPKR